MRKPSEIEQLIFDELLKAEFPGKDAVKKMLDDVLVKTIDPSGSLELVSCSTTIADVVKQVPVEGEAIDVDGVTAHVLLHVRDGRLSELEIFKENGSALSSLERLKNLEVFSLPPYSGNKL